MSNSKRYVFLLKNCYYIKFCNVCKTTIPIDVIYWYYSDNEEKSITKNSIRVCGDCVSLDKENEMKIRDIGDTITSIREL